MSPRSNSRNSVRHRRNRRTRNWFRIILHCMVTALLAELVFLALTSPRLRIARVDVRGAKTISASDIRDRAGCAIGQNLFLANTRTVLRNVRKNPVVRTAKVYRRPLNRLVVRVEERTPFAAVSAAGRTYLMDSEGVVYTETRAVRKGIVALELPGSGRLRIGTRPHPRLISSFFDCLRRALKTGFKVEKISVDPGNNMCLNIQSGLWVKLGQPFDLDGKLVVLKDVLTRKPEIATQALYVDLRCMTAPAWKGRETSPTL
ncbi:MAG: FtsQ-type POTRA domain-containing protein [Armatimonadota bacterium]|nr:FtsQ-type POTRA domain-containing protein [Armatimonadota bacterium]